MTADRSERIKKALGDPERVFSRDQVIDLISLAMGTDDPDFHYRAGFTDGYWARVAEENRAYPPEPLRVTPSAGEDALRTYRARMRVDVRHTRPQDHPGGPVAVW